MGERWETSDAPSGPLGPPEQTRETPEMPPYRRPVPGTVTAVAVLLWIGAVLGALFAGGILALVLLRHAGTLSTTALLLAALLLAAGALAGVCAVMIRRGSRRWRNVTVVLLAINFAGAVSQLFEGQAGAAVVGMGLSALEIYLLAGTESSRRFFERR